MRLISSVTLNSWEGPAGDAAIRPYNSGANYPSDRRAGQAVVEMCLRELSSEWKMVRFRLLKRRGKPRLSLGLSGEVADSIGASSCSPPQLFEVGVAGLDVFEWVALGI